MKRLLIYVAGVLPLLLFAPVTWSQEQPASQQQLEQANDRIAAVAEQRDRAANESAMLKAELVRVARELANLKAEIEKLKPKAEPKK